MIKAFVKAQHLLVLRCDTGRLGTGLVVWVGLRVVKVSTFFCRNDGGAHSRSGLELL